MDLVFLHGPAAAGKLTVAEALHDRLHYPVFHNHLVVDLLTTVFPFGNEPFVRLREQIWLDVFGEAARADRSLVFTFAPEPTVPPGFPSRVRRIVEDADGRVRSVRLTVSEQEQERRIGEDSRRRFHKLTDLDTLRALRARGGEAEQPPVDLAIDTGSTAPAEAAELIIGRFGLQPEPELQRYPSG